MKATLAALAILASVSAADRIEKPALLILPDEVSVRSPFRADVEFRWDGDAPLMITIWKLQGGLSTLGDIHVFDEQGKEVQMVFPVSMPRIPDGEKVVRKGEVMKLGLYLMGSPLFERAGSYYAVATFSSAFSEGTSVRFTTGKRWFQVAKRGPKDV